MPLIYRERVEQIMRACLFGDEVASGKTVIKIETVRFREVGLNAVSVDTYRDEINELLELLPEDFMRPDGAGFQHAYHDKNGEHWGEHIDMETLFALGLATGKVRQVNRRSDWDPFPVYQVLETPLPPTPITL